MILVLGGTSDALEIAAAIYAVNPQVMISAATEYGGTVSKNRFPGRIAAGKMDSDQLKEFLITQGVNCVVDASHPYAENISRYAIQICRELSLPYCRFERPALRQKSDFISCSDFQEAGKIAAGIGGRIFITIGKNHIAQVLAGIGEKARVRVRVLPQSETIRQLEDLGLNADHIIAMKGPFSEEMNYLMFKEAAASVLISKDSGTQGGTDLKILAARRLGMTIILVSRPELDYPNEFSDLESLLDHLQRNHLL